MLEHFDKIETDLVKSIYVLFLDKFEGNKTRFANASECTETTVRRVFFTQTKNDIKFVFKILFCT